MTLLVEMIDKIRKEADDKIAEMQRIEEAYPGWIGIVSSKEFSDWLAALGEPLKGLAASESENDAMLLIEAYITRS